MANETDPEMNPWHPISNSVDLKHLGKLTEELGEASSAVSRCIIQGIEEVEPVTGKSNRQWLEEELADVIAGIHLTVIHFKLNQELIKERVNRKKNQLRSWHKMA